MELRKKLLTVFLESTEISSKTTGTRVRWARDSWGGA